MSNFNKENKSILSIKDLAIRRAENKLSKFMQYYQEEWTSQDGYLHSLHKSEGTR